MTRRHVLPNTSVLSIILVIIAMILGGCTHSQAPLPDVVATWRGGVLTTADLEAWGPKEKHNDTLPDLRRTCEDMALILALADEADTDGVDPAVSRAVEDVVDAILTRTLRRHMASEIVIPDEEIDRVFEKHPDAFRTLQKHRLRNLLLAFPPGASKTEKAAILDRMTELQTRLAAGEDFGDLAEKESDSQTRFRKGLMGNVAPGRLPKAIDRVAMQLGPGEFSSVIETPEGLTVLHCDRIIPARNPSREEVRERLEKNLRNLEEKRRWEALVRELGGDPAAPDSAFRRAAAERARSLGFDREPRTAAATLWAQRRLLAAEALKLRVTAALSEPTPAEVREFFDSNRNQFSTPEAFEVSIIRLNIGTGDPVAIHRKAFELAFSLRSGEGNFKEAARKFSDDASASSGGSLPPMTRRRLAGRGPEFMKTVTALEPGEVGREFMAGGNWYIVRLEGHTARVPMPFEEAASEALDALMEERAAVLQKTIEAEIRGHLDVVIIPQASVG